MPVMDRTVQVVVGIVALLFCQESCLHFCQAEQDEGVSSCLPLGEPPQTGGLHLLTTYIPFYGTHVHSCMVSPLSQLICMVKPTVDPLFISRGRPAHIRIYHVGLIGT